MTEVGTSDDDLHAAVRYGDIIEVEESLKKGCSPNKIGLYQWSPLHEASNNGYHDIVRLLLQNGGDPNVPDNLGGDTSLHYAAREGHPTCLTLLLEAGGDGKLQNFSGVSAIDVASEECKKVLDKKKVEQLMRMSRTQAKNEAAQTIALLYTPPAFTTNQICTKSEEQGNTIRLLSPNQNMKAWAQGINEDAKDVLGSLHMSFEYHAKKDSLKVRLWKLTGLMVSPTHSSMISTIFLKSSLLPDINKTCKRKSEEIKILPLIKKSKSEELHFLTENGTKLAFHPVILKFSKPLAYEGLTKETIAEKDFLIQVFVTQKYTHRKFILSELKIPLNAAITKIVKESYPLKICHRTQLPNTMMIIPENKHEMMVSSDPNLRVSPMASSSRRPASDIHLQEVVSISSQSVSLDIPADVDPYPVSVDEPLVAVSNNKNEETRLQMEEQQESQGFNGDDLPFVVNVHELVSEKRPEIHITIADDSDSASDEDEDQQIGKKKLTNLINRLKFRKANEADLVEIGQSKIKKIVDACSSLSFNEVDENRNNTSSQLQVKLKPLKVASATRNYAMRTLQQSGTKKDNDSAVSIDIELEDLDGDNTERDTVQLSKV